MKDNSKTNHTELETQITLFRDTYARAEEELAKVIVGQRDVLRLVLSGIFAGGNILLEGVPGLGKTLLVKSIAKVFDLSFKRIQFTPDLMPSDVTGTQIISEDENGRKEFVFKAGPIFANIVLADEINRATPKTQAALLEAMEEKQVTVLGQTYELAKPFFVLATQNPVELEGTYPLPEAQLDRFIAKVHVSAPSAAELKEILQRTTGNITAEIRPIFKSGQAAEAIKSLRHLVRAVFVAEPWQDVLIRIINALTPGNQFATAKTSKYLRYGPGPRGAQAIMLLAKVQALLEGRINLAFDDIKSILTPALRHRLVMNFQAEADGITADQIIEEVKSAK
ncbi:MAG TPA: AAA family ATPase [Oligoflexia bacterium]|nr:AAA family ATPase [Oligoflexia bacterium]HMP26457.1 AAA family ATPase [Oligoflexia bacterium]